MKNGWGCHPAIPMLQYQSQPPDTAMATFIPTVADRDTLAASLAATFPASSVQRSTLGGEQHASLHFTVSFDPREEWANGILENSRYAQFTMSAGKIYMISGSYSKIAKFRKANAGSVEEAVIRIRAWKAKN